MFNIKNHPIIPFKFFLFVNNTLGLQEVVRPTLACNSCYGDRLPCLVLAQRPFRHRPIRQRTRRILSPNLTCVLIRVTSTKMSVPKEVSSDPYVSQGNNINIVERLYPYFHKPTPIALF